MSLAAFAEFAQTISPALFDLSHRPSCLDLFTKPRAPIDHIKRQLVVDVFVRRLLPLEFIGIEPADRADDRRAGDDRLERIPIDDMYLNSPAEFALELVKRRLEMKRTKDDAGQVFFPQLLV